MTNKHDSPRDIEDLLASDDELPSSYNESPETPAYLLQSRFEPIKFAWIENAQENYKKLTNKENTPHPSLVNEKTIYSKIQQLNIGEESLLTKGVLSRIDSYCLKSIGTYANGATVLWLINFFMHKDLHASYNFLRSCLVSKYSEVDDKTLETMTRDLKNVAIEIVIK